MNASHNTAPATPNTPNFALRRAIGGAVVAVALAPAALLGVKAIQSGPSESMEPMSQDALNALPFTEVKAPAGAGAEKVILKGDKKAGVDDELFSVNSAQLEPLVENVEGQAPNGVIQHDGTTKYQVHLLNADTANPAKAHNIQYPPVAGD